MKHSLRLEELKAVIAAEINQVIDNLVGNDVETLSLLEQAITE